MLSDELEGYDSINVSDSHLPFPHQRIHSMDSAFFLAGGFFVSVTIRAAYFWKSSFNLHKSPWPQVTANVIIATR